MILHCNYEEIQALKQGAVVLVRGGFEEGESRVAAPPFDVETVEWLATELRGDVQVETLADARTVAGVLTAIVDVHREAMDREVVASHPAAEPSVAAYFDYAHSIAVLGRLRRLEAEMEAMIEVVTGSPATRELAESFLFPD